MRKIPILVALLLVAGSALGQHARLLLQKQNQNKSAYYEVGDELIFYREGKKSKTKDRIVAFEDSTIVFRGYRVPVSQITALHIDDQTRWWLRFKPAQLLLIGGAGYLLIDAVNDRAFNPDTLVIGGSLIGLGLIFKLFIPNKIKIRGKTKLMILEV